ncbi:glycosyltransferase 87 family protein [Lentzea nigeriaca]|uniref:glycosyltransferase 87 family protein n=1 Tax=Lentzea nigeriaca TaxID=1128665 RepID=UPI001956E0E5|nr:glycosyltransferase 87 family protein [Lentzea nigeriaca]MBM7857253.1 alpha-1,2-mannosyltransferase [Lentzea nigeriaca]
MSLLVEKGERPFTAVRRPSTVAVLALLVIAAGAALNVALSPDGPLVLSDARIYRAAAELWWRDGDLYREHLYGGGNPAFFTYPPFALLPIAVVFYDFTFGAAVLMVGGVAALFHICSLVIERLRPSLPHRYLVAAAATLCATHLEPVTSTLFWGQINIFLLWLVAVDCLSRSARWPRGLAVGVAAAIKLTPLCFVLFFLLGKQIRPTVTAFVSFAVCGGVGFLVAPAISVDFWTRAVFDPDRVGNVLLPANESLRGVLARLDLAPATWMVASAAVVALTAFVVFRYRAQDHDVPAWLAVAAMGTLVSPMSWSHHWVWLIALLVAATVWAITDARPYPRLVPAGLVSIAMIFAPHLHLAATSWWHPLAESYVWIGLALLIVLAAADVRRRCLRGARSRPVESQRFSMSNVPGFPGRARLGDSGTPSHSGHSAQQ